MASTTNLLEKRFYSECGYGYDSFGNCYSPWDSWARWVVLGCVIAAAILIFFLFACISARRRRKMGYAPYRGTGWVPGAGGRHHANAPPPENFSNTPYYAPNNNYGNNTYAAPPPSYQGYYGRNDNVEMQPPYQNVYSPPSAPPKR